MTDGTPSTQSSTGSSSREDEQLLLGGEHAVDQRLVDADRAGDLVDRRVLEAPLVEHRARRRNQLLPAKLARRHLLGGGHRSILRKSTPRENSCLTVVLIFL